MEEGIESPVSLLALFFSLFKRDDSSKTRGYRLRESNVLFKERGNLE
jgi:hypothetical protein